MVIAKKNYERKNGTIMKLKDGCVMKIWQGQIFTILFKVPFKQTKIYEKCKYVLILKLIKNH